VLASRAMSTYELAPRVPRSPARGIGAASLRPAMPGAGGSLAIALLLVLLYAAFAQGAVSEPAEARLQVATAAIGALAAGAWLWAGRLRVQSGRLGWLAVGLLVAFALWSGISLLWSVTPDQSWIELNRYLEYALVLCLGIAVGASLGRSLELVAGGFLLVVLAVSLYALGQKLAPGLHLSGVFDLNQTGAFSRLQQPLGYWNALALFAVLGVPQAAAMAIDDSLPTWLRLAALASLEVLLLVIAFTYSRGGLLALAVAIIALIVLSGRRLRALLWLAVTGLATIAPLLYGLLSRSLSASGVALGAREGAGALLAILLVLSLAALILIGLRMIALERRVVITAARRRSIVRFLLALGGAGILAILLAIAMSARGLTGTFSHAWQSFTSAQGVSQGNPSRLLSFDSEYRWGWWKEAVSAFLARPLGGWGAGSFPVVHLLYRENGLSVMQPHSVPLQWLAETGIVGALLGVGAFLSLLGAGVGAARRSAPGRARLLAGAIVAAGFAYAIHACYDWDSDIPGVTLPVLVLLGALAGSSASGLRADGRSTHWRGWRGPGADLRVGLSGRRPGDPVLARGLASGWRAAAVVAAALSMCAFALSGAMPSLAASDASRALTAASAAGRRSLAHAAALAFTAGRLDPLSDAGPRTGAILAIRENSYARARDELLIAVRRDPSDAGAWETLARVDLELGDLPAALSAARRSMALDPHGWEDPQDQNYRSAAEAVVAALLLEAPPGSSATRLPTPGYAVSAARG
jgi:hypothetical protein